MARKTQNTEEIALDDDADDEGRDGVKLKRDERGVNDEQAGDGEQGCSDEGAGGETRHPGTASDVLHAALTCESADEPIEQQAAPTS
jgi:hypothetical protein